MVSVLPTAATLDATTPGKRGEGGRARVLDHEMNARP